MVAAVGAAVPVDLLVLRGTLQCPRWVADQKVDRLVGLGEDLVGATQDQLELAGLAIENDEQATARRCVGAFDEPLAGTDPVCLPLDPQVLYSVGDL